MPRPMPCWARRPSATSESISRTPTPYGKGSTAVVSWVRSSESVALEGWKVGNCDVVIHAQEPKLTTHKPAIRENLARLLRVDLSAVNVKAKTGEHVGPIGRGEAIACEAIVLLFRVEATEANT